MCDHLISKGILSEDDWEILHKTKRSKSKIKRLISILSKRDDPKTAFTALLKCIELHHRHLSKTVQKALDCFPTADINSNVYHSGVEHVEGVSNFSGDSVIPRTRDDHRDPVQHDETAVSSYFPCQIDKFPDAGKHNEKLSQTDDKYCMHNESTKNNNVDFQIENNENNNFISDVLPKYGSLGLINKGQGIQCTDQKPFISNTSYVKNLESINDAYRRENDISKSLVNNSLYNETEECLDFVDGATGFNNLDGHFVDNVSDNFGFSNENNDLSQTRVRTDTGNLIGCVNESQNNTPGTVPGNGHSGTHRLEIKRLKHLLSRPQSISASVEVESAKSNPLESNCYSVCDSDGNRFGVITKPKSNSRKTIVYPVSNSSRTCSAQKQPYHGSEKSVNEEGMCASSHISDDNSFENDNDATDVFKTTAAQLQLQSSVGVYSRQSVTRRHKVCAGNYPRKPIKSDSQTPREENASLSLSPPRALSQIDYCPSSVLDNCMNRAQSWAGPRTRSHIYDGLSSCSEDYTTTDLNYSDLNEMERELCDNLEKSGSITDIVDRLIQDDYFSNDDWCAINEIKVKRNQATFVAKRISNKLRHQGCQNFSNMLRNQPELSKWLSSKFENVVTDALPDENSLKAECEPSYNDGNISKLLDQTDGAGRQPYFHSDISEGPDSLAVAACSHDQNANKTFVGIETLCAPGIVVDKHFQKVFDTLNTAFNKGTLPVTHLPSDPNVKCIVLYLKACDALYKTQNEDAERYINLAEAAVDDTDCPVFMRGEIFTPKTWLCLRTNRLGVMEQLLEENEQFLLANPNIWSNKAAGWFYFDYGRFNVRMMAVTKPSRNERPRGSQRFRQTAYEVYQDKAKRCLRKSIDYFAHSDSSDGPIGMGFSISLLASVELDCVTEFSYLNRIVKRCNISEAEKLLQTVADLYDEIPDILKTSYMLSKSDLCFRKNELHVAKELVKECAELSDKLCLQDELKECEKRKRLLNRFA